MMKSGTGAPGRAANAAVAIRKRWFAVFGLGRLMGTAKVWPLLDTLSSDRCSSSLSVLNHSTNCTEPSADEKISTISHLCASNGTGSGWPNDNKLGADRDKAARQRLMIWGRIGKASGR